ncbi:PREDICTED: uncharacterized protein LOC106324029 [Brassica oleracea var. oleracea]|uniref:uncharacterized protein LOC106324029 n=1 Tax=Brassica oleracea var. oleracea TaxID=109376 RepID=UPI0006A72550|nr:PREDICTED: uncharacterized protein LOC106324029 [Brassica oleracea var. oleracea]
MATSNDGSSSGEEREAPETTPASFPATPAPLPPSSIETIMVHLAQQDAAQKAATNQIAALVKILAPLAANVEASTVQYRRHLFNTEKATGATLAHAEDKDVNDGDTAQTPGGLDAQTINELAELKQSVLDINSKIHNVTTSSPQIELVLVESLWTPFTEKITGVRLRKMDKLHLPTFNGVSDPSTHVTSFNIAIRRANLSDEEKHAGFCQLFVETLKGIALNWFTGLQENSVNSFHDLSTAFLKNYIMFTRQEANATDLWNLNHANGQSLRDFMEKFKSVVSKVGVPDHIAVESLMNTLHIKSPFRADLYRHPRRSVSDAIARSNNFIRMEKDTRAKAAKEGAGKQTPARTNDTRQEPRQHSTGSKPNQKRGYMNVVDEEDPSGSAVVVREKGWNPWDRDTAQQKSSSPEPTSSNAGTKQVVYWNNKSWSKTKDKKTQKSQARAHKKEERASPERALVNNLNLDGELTDEEPPKNRRRVEVILSRHDDSSDDEIPSIAQDLHEQLGRKTDSKDLRALLKRKAAKVSVSKTDLRSTHNESKARKTAHTVVAPSPQPQPTDLCQHINSKAEDLRVKFSQYKKRDLRPCLEVKRQAQLELMKATGTPHLNVIMGGLPHGGDSVRAVKDYRRQAITAQKWPTQVEADHQISFSAVDTCGISMPHNDPLLIDIGIGECQVTKFLVDTGNSVDLIFRDTLDKMEIDLRDMKRSSRTLTGFNGSSEQMIGTIRFLVYAGDVTRTVKFSVIRAKCVKFPGKDGTTQTIRGDQRAARELLMAAVKLQQSVPLVNSVAKPIHKIHPQKEEFREVNIDEADPTKVIRVGAFLSDEMQSQVISFLRANASTFAWTTSDMKGIDPILASHELNVNPTFKPIRQKRRKLGPERSKAVNEEVDRLLEAGFIAEVRYPEWLANPVVVKKKNGKWRICVDFTDLNKACPKDSYPLPHIDRLVESTAGNELLTFMDAFSGYNQILMHPDDHEKTAFIADRGTYCYKVMSFGLKNAGATYQRLVNQMFAGKLGDTMEVYIDDMLVKSLHAENHLDHLRDCFTTLNEFGIKLNPAKCTFGVTSGEFLGYIVTQRGIEASPKQITTILDLPSPRNSREVQRLTGRIAALNRFIPRSTDKCLPFYELLRGNK